MKNGVSPGPVNENYRWLILILLTFAQSAMSMGAYAWGPLAPFLRLEFGISRVQVGFIVSALYLASVFVGVPAGMMTDRVGARRMLVFSLLLMGGALGAILLPGRGGGPGGLYSNLSCPWTKNGTHLIKIEVCQI